MEDEKIIHDVTVQNIVASVNLFVAIPLEKVSAKIKNTEYDPEQFPGLVFRIRDPKVSALLFSSGKVVCTGARRIEDVENAIKILSKKLKTVDSYRK